MKVIRAQRPSFRTNTITYYVDANGDDGNPGEIDAPVQTPQRAMDLCASKAETSPGPFTIQFETGTYTTSQRIQFSAALFVTSPVTFKGKIGEGGTPSVIITGSEDGTRTHTFADPAGGALLFLFQDIYFHSFSTVSAPGQGGRSVMTRCWAKNCASVIAANVGGIGAAFGGDWDGRDLDDVLIEGGTGFITVIVSPFNLRQTDFDTGLKIHHWETGVLVDECGTGHMNYLRVHDCSRGVHIMRGAGSPNMGFLQIHRCTIGILAQSTSSLLIANSMDFGQGTADACGTNVVCTAAPIFQQEVETAYNTRHVYLVFSLTGGGNLTGSTAERPLWSPVINITEGRVRAQDTFDVHMYASGVTTADGTLRLYFGETLVQAWTVPAGMTNARIELMLEALNGEDWRGQIYQVVETGSSPIVSLTKISDQTGITSLTADTEVSLTWQAGAEIDYFQMYTGRLYSSIAGLGFA